MPLALQIALFGVLGVLCRYGADQTFGGWNDRFPFVTLGVNILGCFLAGCIYAWSIHRDITPTLQTALVVGFCGGFTTFSAYSLQVVGLIERGKWLAAATYFTASPMLGLIAAFLPVLIVRKWLA